MNDTWKALSELEHKIATLNEEASALERSAREKKIAAGDARNDIAPLATQLLREEGAAALQNAAVATCVMNALTFRRKDMAELKEIIRDLFTTPECPGVRIAFAADSHLNPALDIQLTGEDTTIQLPQNFKDIFDSLWEVNNHFCVNFTTPAVNSEHNTLLAKIKRNHLSEVPIYTTYLGNRRGNTANGTQDFNKALNIAIRAIQEHFRPVRPITGDIKLSFGEEGH